MFCLHRLNPSNPSSKHFADAISDVEPREADIDNVSAIIRDKAWEELPKPISCPWPRARATNLHGPFSASKKP